MTDEPLKIYALSAPNDVEMVSVTALSEFEICCGVTSDGEIKCMKVAIGEVVELEPDTAAFLHRDGVVQIQVEG